MAGGGGNLKRAHLYEYKITNYFIFACLVASTGGSIFGYEIFLHNSLLFSFFFLGGVINAAAVNIGMLIVGRILLGVGIGFGNQVKIKAPSEMFCYMIGVAITLALKFGEGEELPQAIGWFLVFWKRYVDDDDEKDIKKPTV
ncbi:sugar transport protein 14 [Hibiscus trionum]|uniref:Sugar transport protein 14 n=1 Tax=Hibiscus trionum TaxID=183268 RepID=A0A9W7MQ17_HIBTR|nr:sugar transport protein 14 [Hibiscus trionum]